MVNIQEEYKSIEGIDIDNCTTDELHEAFVVEWAESKLKQMEIMFLGGTVELDKFHDATSNLIEWSLHSYDACHYIVENISQDDIIVDDDITRQTITFSERDSMFRLSVVLSTLISAQREGRWVSTVEWSDNIPNMVFKKRTAENPVCNIHDIDMDWIRSNTKKSVYQCPIDGCNEYKRLETVRK